MCMISRGYDTKYDDVDIKNLIPYKIMMKVGENEYSFECFNDKNIIVTPPLGNLYDLGKQFKQYESEYSESNRSLDDFVSACKKICMDYMLV